MIFDVDSGTRNQTERYRRDETSTVGVSASLGWRATRPFPSYSPANLTLPVRKIAVLRSNAIGDYVFSLPALNALRLAYPEAEIVLLGLPWHVDFVTGRPGPVDRVVVVPRMRGVREAENFTGEDPAEIDAFFLQMQAEQFDLAIQMYGGGRHSNPFVRRLGASFTVGLRTPDAEPLDCWMPYNFYQSEVFRLIELVSLVGAYPTGFEPHLEVTASDRAEAARSLPAAGRPLAVLHPGAGDPRRRWPVEKFVAVGNSLAWAGAQVAVTGWEAERDLVDGVVGGMSAEAVPLCGSLTVGGLAGLLSQARVVVSNDSGPLHLAGAVGAATVGLFWVGNLINAGPLTRTRHRPLISWRLECPVCGLNCTRSTCDHPVSFVDDIGQTEVVASALELFRLGQPANERAQGLLASAGNPPLPFST